MRIERLPRFSEQLQLRTWCSGVAKSVAERSTSITGDLGAAVEVEAIWVHIDPESRRPARLPPTFADAYGLSAAGRRPRSSLRHPPAPPTDAERLQWAFSRADVDIFGHVNNAMYWRVAEEHLQLDRVTDGGGVLEAEYRAGIGTGPATIHRSGEMLWISGAGGEVAATLLCAHTSPNRA